MNGRLQALRIPTGCLVNFNAFWEIDPKGHFPADSRWMILTEDILQINQPNFNRVLDVGWYPEGDLARGRYRLVVYEGDFLGRLLHTFETRDRLTLVSEIERLLVAICNRRI